MAPDFHPLTVLRGSTTAPQPMSVGPELVSVLGSGRRTQPDRPYRAPPIRAFPVLFWKKPLGVAVAVPAALVPVPCPPTPADANRHRGFSTHVKQEHSIRDYISYFDQLTGCDHPVPLLHPLSPTGW